MTEITKIWNVIKKGATKVLAAVGIKSLEASFTTLETVFPKALAVGATIQAEVPNKTLAEIEAFCTKYLLPIDQQLLSSKDVTATLISIAMALLTKEVPALAASGSLLGLAASLAIHAVEVLEPATVAAAAAPLAVAPAAAK